MGIYSCSRLEPITSATPKSILGIHMPPGTGKTARLLSVTGSVDNVASGDGTSYWWLYSSVTSGTGTILTASQYDPDDPSPVVVARHTYTVEPLSPSLWTPASLAPFRGSFHAEFDADDARIFNNLTLFVRAWKASAAFANFNLLTTMVWEE